MGPKNKFWSRAGGVAVLLAAMAFVPMNAEPQTNVESQTADVCTSGKLSGRLTGWMMDGELPSGQAGFDAEKNVLEVSVESVNLKDGTRLFVYINDKKIGQLDGLAKGVTKSAITLSEDLDEGSRVRVLSGDRPIVSGNVTCEKSDTASAKN
jgi:hypothetical protein